MSKVSDMQIEMEREEPTLHSSKAAHLAYIECEKMILVYEQKVTNMFDKLVTDISEVVNGVENEDEIKRIWEGIACRCMDGAVMGLDPIMKMIEKV